MSLQKRDRRTVAVLSFSRNGQAFLREAAQRTKEQQLNARCVTYCFQKKICEGLSVDNSPKTSVLKATADLKLFG